jgi:hypothetical protein
MIESDITAILQNNATIVSSLGGIDKICYIQPSAKMTMPWLVIEVSSGEPIKLSASRQQVTAVVRATLSISKPLAYKGRTIMEEVKNTLRGLRGDATESDDLYILCGEVTGYPGVGEVSIFNLICTCRYMEDWVTQHI